MSYDKNQCPECAQGAYVRTDYYPGFDGDVDVELVYTCGHRF